MRYPYHYLNDARAPLNEAHHRLKICTNFLYVLILRTRENFKCCEPNGNYVVINRITINKTTTIHELILGEALEALDELEKSSVDLAFIDPPYNIGKKFATTQKKLSDDKYIDWCKEWLDKIYSLLSNSGSLYLMAATQYMPYLDLHLRKTFHILNRIVWYYDSSGVQAKKLLGSMYEPIILCVKNKKNYTFNCDPIKISARTGAVRKLIDYRKNPPKPYNTKKNPGNVWYFPRVRFRMPEYLPHPSQKPELLLERIILASSNIGDLILDPFAGTFTTNAVAVKLRRNSIGIEIEPEYFEAGTRRLRDAMEGEEIANKHNYGKTPQAMDLHQ